MPYDRQQSETERAQTPPNTKKITTRIYIDDANNFKTILLHSQMNAQMVVNDVVQKGMKLIIFHKIILLILSTFRGLTGMDAFRNLQ